MRCMYVYSIEGERKRTGVPWLWWIWIYDPMHPFAGISWEVISVRFPFLLSLYKLPSLPPFILLSLPINQLSLTKLTHTHTQNNTSNHIYNHVYFCFSPPIIIPCRPLRRASAYSHRRHLAACSFRWLIN